MCVIYFVTLGGGLMVIVCVAIYLLLLDWRLLICCGFVLADWGFRLVWFLAGWHGVAVLICAVAFILRLHWLLGLGVWCLVWLDVGRVLGLAWWIQCLWFLFVLVDLAFVVDCFIAFTDLRCICLLVVIYLVGLDLVF